MTLGDILAEAARRDLSSAKKGGILYHEFIVGDKFEIKLSTPSDPDAYIECSVPDEDTEKEKDYCRLYFISMIMNAAIFGMKRKKQQKLGAPAPWIARIFEYCEANKIAPEALIEFHKKGGSNAPQDTLQT